MYTSITYDKHYSSKLSVHVAERVVNAMVTGHLDASKSLLHVITSGQLEMIQKIQNIAARLILRRNRRSNATVMLHELHWLPIKKRFIYKFILMVYTSQQDMIPDYITVHLLDYRPSRLLRSAEYKKFVHKKRIHTTNIYNFRWPWLNCGMRQLFNSKAYKQLRTYLFMLNLWC